MVYGDLIYYELVPISMLNTTSMINSAHMFKNITLSPWFELSTQKPCLLKKMKLKTTHETRLEIGVSSLV